MDESLVVSIQTYIPVQQGSFWWGMHYITYSVVAVFYKDIKACVTYGSILKTFIFV
jgi:hypothetical protein